MLKAFIGKLLELSEQDENIAYLTADSGTGYDELYKKLFPNRFYDFGIEEQNMIAVSAGMASEGKIPFVYCPGAFMVNRALEFIRLDVCYNNSNVKLIGTGSGLTWSRVGPPHQTTEDISVLRCMPNLTILSPSTPKQAAQSVEIAYKINGPVLIRLGMIGEREFFDDKYEIKLSKNDVLLQGSDAVVYTTGSILSEVYDACGALAKIGKYVKLVNVSTLKPFDYAGVTEDAKAYGKIFTVEEHNIYGGLGSMVAEAVAYNGINAKVCPIGLNDTFSTGYGSYRDVLCANGLDAQSIYEKIEAEL